VAVGIVKQTGKPISQIAKEMGLTESALRKWVKQAQVDQAAAPNGPLTTEERQELAKLRRDIKRLQMERDFLKKTAAFCFARASLYAAETSPPMS
jgi:transposase